MIFEDLESGEKVVNTFKWIHLSTLRNILFIVMSMIISICWFSIGSAATEVWLATTQKISAEMTWMQNITQNWWPAVEIFAVFYSLMYRDTFVLWIMLTARWMSVGGRDSAIIFVCLSWAIRTWPLLPSTSFVSAFDCWMHGKSDCTEVISMRTVAQQ